MRCLLFLLSVTLLCCGSPPHKKNNVVIGPKDTNTTVVLPPKEVIIAPVIPEGAVQANFISGVEEFYGYVKHVDSNKGFTTIAFEKETAPQLTIPKAYGAVLSYLRFDEFDRDLLLLNTRLKDPNFDKYYLYILKNGQWLPVVNGWAIHKDNRPDTLSPIYVDPENPGRMFRYYSVFDLDATSELGYTWRLFNESIPIENK